MISFSRQVPFRIGTSSYIIPADILPNVRYLAGQVRDVELVLFELDDGQSNLPDDALREELRQLAAEHDMTFTVHLPLDLSLGSDSDEQHLSLVKARRVIEATQEINPWAYVLHLDGKEFRQGATASELRRWQDQSVRALEIVAGWAGGFERLAVENLDTYPPDFNDPVLERVPVSRCVDVGHLWKDGHDPLPYLERWLPRTRVMHIHGIAERDHKSLAHVPGENLDLVLRYLMQQSYSGVFTMEIFSEEDFHSSLAALQDSFARLSEWSGG